MDQTFLVPAVFILFVVCATGYLIWSLFRNNKDVKQNNRMAIVWRVVQILVLLALAWAFFDFFLHGPRV